MAVFCLDQVNDSVCPFCGLLCDDIEINRSDSDLTINSDYCPIAERRYQESFDLKKVEATIEGETVTREDAFQRAVELIRGAKAPLIAGLETDVAGARAAIALADRIGAVIDHRHNRPHHLVSSRMQAYGGYFTTLSEIKSRSDLILFVGNQILSSFPRLLSRTKWIQNENSELGPKRKFVWIGKCSSTEQIQASPFLMECELLQVSQIASTIRAYFEPRRNIIPEPDTFSIEDVEKIVDLIKNAQYPVFIWSSAEMDFQMGDLVVDSLIRLIDSVNLKQRCAGMSLSNCPATTTVNQVATWQCGKPLPLSFREGSPEYHPIHFSSKSILEQNDVDLVIWVGGLENEISTPNSSAKLIAMTNTNPGNANVFFPVGVPGIHHDSHLFRTDNVVSLYQKALLPQSLNSSAETIRVILNRLNNT